MEFSVNPMDSYNQYVHPIASTIKYFLRLLLACGNATKNLSHIEIQVFSSPYLNS